MSARGFGSIPLEAHPLTIASEDVLLGVNDTDFAGRRELAERAKNIIRDEVLPAYFKLAAQLDAFAIDAPTAPGLWQFSQGAEWYQTALYYYSSDPGIDPDSLHAQGEELVWSLTAQLDIALTEQGFTEGSVGERLAELSIREDQTFTNDEAGRDELLQQMQADLGRIRFAVEPYFPRPPEARVAITQVPEFIQATAPGGYYTPASADGSAPGYFFINLPRHGRVATLCPADAGLP